MDPSSRPPRKVGIADHIWELFEEMASQMGSDRDALINQAMFMFARLNGFSENAAGNGHAKANGNAANGRSPPAQARPQAAPPVLAPAKGPARPEPPAQKLDDDPVRREVAERVLETAAELERLIKGKNQNQDQAEGEESSGMEGVDVEEPASDAGGGNALYLMAEGGELDRIAKDRFVIGRGKHCDFVINSGKVSREHAVIIRDGGDYYIEDLGSSNGTWFNKQRIKRRKVEDGDEYFICSEKVKLVFR
jgi:pSer/pThr/pTyr-binding forkhead associated (FHA) protein